MNCERLQLGSLKRIGRFNPVDGYETFGRTIDSKIMVLATPEGEGCADLSRSRRGIVE
jgi:hypothetical protein